MSTPSLLIDCTAFHPSCAAGGVSLYMKEILKSNPNGPAFTAFYNKIESGILNECGTAIHGSHEIKGNMLVWRDRGVRQLAKSGCKGVWFPTQFSAWLPVIPSLVTIHDMAAYLSWSSFSALGKAYMPTSLLASCIHAKSILAISESTANDLNRLFPWTKRRTVVARHGLPSDARAKSIQVGTSCHRMCGPYSLLFLDGANPRKRLDLCLLALEKIGWNGIELIITGKPDLIKSRIKKILGELPRNISLVGYLDRNSLLNTIASSDILLYPSDFEGFGFPIIESMAFGTSVVSFPGNAEKEIGGDFAVYSEQRNHVNLSFAIQSAMERCRDSSWQSALNRHANSFTWNDSMHIHRLAFEDLLS